MGQGEGETGGRWTDETRDLKGGPYQKDGLKVVFTWVSESVFEQNDPKGGHFMKETHSKQDSDEIVRSGEIGRKLRPLDTAKKRRQDLRWSASKGAGKIVFP